MASAAEISGNARARFNGEDGVLGIFGGIISFTATGNAKRFEIPAETLTSCNFTVPAGRSLQLPVVSIVWRSGADATRVLKIELTAPAKNYSALRDGLERQLV